MILTSVQCPCTVHYWPPVDVHRHCCCGSHGKIVTNVAAYHEYDGDTNFRDNPTETGTSGYPAPVTGGECQESFQCIEAGPTPMINHQQAKELPPEEEIIQTFMFCMPS